MDKKYISILALLLVLSSMVMISAVVTLSAPTASSQITGQTVLFNATNSTTFEQMENCTFYGSSANTANSSITSFGTGTNSSIGNETIIALLNSSNFEDGNAYKVFASCWNVTADQENSTNVTVIIDNGVPTTPSSLSPVASSTDADGTINFSATVDNPSTTACTLYFPNRTPGSTSYTMSYTGASCYYNLASIPEESFDYYIQASDGLNTTDSTTTRFNVYIEGSSGFLFQGAGGTGTQTSVISDSKILGMNPGVFWTILILLIIASYFYFKK